MKGGSPTISVVIVSHNTRQVTLDCLRTIYGELSNFHAEVWVIDNGSIDASAEAIEHSFPAVRMIKNTENLGFGAANNQALREARGEFILLLNSDAFPSPGSIATLVNHLREHSQVAVVGPRLLNRDQTLQRSCYRFPSPFRATCEHLLLTAAFPENAIVGDYRNWPHDEARDVDFIIGACMLVRREAIERVGLFDETFFLYGEETDWCRRFKQAGWRVSFLPAAQAIHLGGASGRSQPVRVFREFRLAQEHYLRKHHGFLGLLFYRIMITLGSCIRILVFSMRWITWPSLRSDSRERVQLWLRILVWNLGIRGEGLRSVARAR